MDSPAIDGPTAPDSGCAREDCWTQPSKTAWLSLASAGAPRIRREAPLGVEFCAAHALEVTLDDLLDGEVWSAILAKFRAEGLPPPTPKLTKLELRDIEEE